MGLSGSAFRWLQGQTHDVRLSNDCLTSNTNLVYIYLLSAKMEAADNDIPPSVPFRVSGFPTIKFKKAGTRDFIDYNGDRSLENLIAFVHESAKNSLDTPIDDESAPAQEPLVEGERTHDEL